MYLEPCLPTVAHQQQLLYTFPPPVCVCLCVTMCAWMTSSGKQWFPQPVTRSRTPTGISVHLPVSFFKLCCTPGCGEGAERHFVFVFSAHVYMYERTCMHILLVLGVYYSIFVSKTTTCVCVLVFQRDGGSLRSKCFSRLLLVPSYCKQLCHY